MTSRLRMSALVTLLVAVALLIGLVVSPSVMNASAAATPAQQPVTMIYGMLQEPDSLNPFVGYLSAAYAVWAIVYDLLVGIGPNYEAVPQVAESWSVSPDNLTWTFNLYDNITWHDDGTPLTAHDIEWTYEFIINESAGAYSGYLTKIYPNDTYAPAYADAIEAVDDYTLQITTLVPKAPGLMMDLWVPILKKEEWSQIPANQALQSYRNKPPTGSGPWIFDTWVAGQYIQFHRNPNYHLGSPKFDLFIMKFYLNPVQVVEDLRAGLIHATGSIGPDQWAGIQDEPNVRTYAVQEIGFSELGLNAAPEWTLGGGEGVKFNRELRNTSVRQALAQVIDKQFLVDIVHRGLATPGSSQIPPVIPYNYHYVVPDNELYKFNLAAANATLDPYYWDFDGDGVRENRSNRAEKLSFTLTMIDYYTEEQAAMEYYRDWAAQVGIELRPEIVNEGQMITISLAANYDLYVWGWGGDADPDFLLSVMTTEQIPSAYIGGFWQDAWYSNPDYDDLYYLQQTQTNLTERRATVWEMQRILYRDTPYIILWYSPTLYGVRTDKFSNWPNFEQYPGLAMFGMGNGFMFLQVTPGPTEPNTPPYSVDIGGPYVNVLSNWSYPYAATAQDAEDTNLSFTWNFGDATPVQMVTVSNATGTFTAQTSHTYTRPGTYTLNLTVSDGQTFVYDETTVTVVEPTGTEGTVRGFAKDATGTPLPGVSIVLAGGAGSISTAANGSYAIVAPAGTYAIWANKTGYTGDTDTATIEIGMTSWVNFTLTSVQTTVSGTVKDADGDPIAAALVQVKDAAGSTVGQDTTDPQGNYSILLAPGTYNITVTATGYEPYTAAITVQPNVPLAHDVTLTKVARGLGALAWAGIALVVIVAAVAVAVLLLRRKKAAGGTGGAGPPEAPP